MLAELDRTGEDQISLTDPDSRAMAAHTRVAVGYNVQVAVDAKHKLIVEQQVTNQLDGAETDTVAVVFKTTLQLGQEEVDGASGKVLDKQATSTKGGFADSLNLIRKT